MAQTAEKLSDYYQHVCTYFSITQKEIENLATEIKEDLVKYLGPLKRPFKTVEQFKSDKATEEQDIIVRKNETYTPPSYGNNGCSSRTNIIY